MRKVDEEPKENDYHLMTRKNHPDIPPALVLGHLLVDEILEMGGKSGHKPGS